VLQTSRALMRYARARTFRSSEREKKRKIVRGEPSNYYHIICRVRIAARCVVHSRDCRPIIIIRAGTAPAHTRYRDNSTIDARARTRCAESFTRLGRRPVTVRASRTTTGAARRGRHRDNDADERMKCKRRETVVIGCSVKASSHGDTEKKL